ncbi:MAG: hypothetical protein JWL77_6132 [Chthonomonadaceae bacterium]|nr:hypothetical protein [Chthonomonadaceae bacterium]
MPLGNRSRMPRNDVQNGRITRTNRRSDVGPERRANQRQCEDTDRKRGECDRATVAARLSLLGSQSGVETRAQVSGRRNLRGGRQERCCALAIGQFAAA